MKAVRTYSRKPREHEAVLLPGAEWLCRLCLEEPSDPTPIFTSTDGVGLCLATRITFCVGLEMTQEDCLPNQICWSCFKILDQCYQFRKKCEASYQRLKSHSLAKIIEKSKIEKNFNNQTENKLESNNDENHDSRNITENYSNEDSSNINVEIYDIEETNQRNDVEMCYAEKTSHANAGGNSLLLHRNRNSLVLEIDGTDLMQPTDLGLDVFPQQSTSISVLQCKSVQSKPNQISSTYQLKSQPTQISPPPLLQSQPRPSLLLASQKCPPLQSHPPHLRIPQPSLFKSKEIQQQISSPKQQIQPTSLAQSQLSIIQNQQIKLSIATTTSQNQEDVDWVIIDPPATQSQAIRLPTIKLQPLNIPNQKSPTKTLQSCNNNNQNQTKSLRPSLQLLNSNHIQCKHEPPTNMNVSSLLENILTCVGALKHEEEFVALNGVTEVDLMMGEGTVVNMELVEEDEEDISDEVKSQTVVKMARLDTIVQPRSQAGNAVRKSCSVCNMTFATSSTRARHERDVHSCARPYTCDTCGASFRQRSVLQRHLNTHMETRPFPCRKCPKTFAQRGSMLIHAKSHEPKWVRDLYVKKCPHDNCDKTFQYPSGLSRHLQWHDGRHFVCHACRQAFTDKSALQRHLRSEKHKRKTGNKDVGRYEYIIQSNNRENKYK